MLAGVVAGAVWFVAVTAVGSGVVKALSGVVALAEGSPNSVSSGSGTSTTMMSPTTLCGGLALSLALVCGCESHDFAGDCVAGRVVGVAGAVGLASCDSHFFIASFDASPTMSSIMRRVGQIVPRVINRSRRLIASA